MKQKLTAFFSVLFLLFLPLVARAQTDLSVSADDISLGEELEAVQAGKEIRIFATVANQGEKDAVVDVQFFAAEELLGTRNVTVLAGNDATAFWDWTPSAAGMADIKVALLNSSETDENSVNDQAVLTEIEVLGSENAEVTNEEAVVVLEEKAAEDTTAPNPDEVMETTASESSLQVMIQTQRVAWNAFRFLPAGFTLTPEQAILWNFGDGSSATQALVDHTYKKPGKYQVSLQITGSDQVPHTGNTNVTVGFLNLANWRLWVILALLAMIIIIAAVVVGMSSSLPETIPATAPAIASRKKDFENDDELESLTQESGDLDALASAGESKSALEDDLSLLEKLHDDHLASATAVSAPLIKPLAPLAKIKVPKKIVKKTSAKPKKKVQAKKLKK